MTSTGILTRSGSGCFRASGERRTSLAHENLLPAFGDLLTDIVHDWIDPVRRNTARIELFEATAQSGRRYENGDAAAQCFGSQRALRTSQLAAIYELRPRDNSSISSSRAEPDVQLSRGMHYLPDNATSKNVQQRVGPPR
jgi:hypothetical protein